MEEIITLDYGSGGLRTSQLIESVLVPAFQNPALEDLGDGAVLPSMDGPLVYSTDSFVVTPWRFPGGDIGKLAVCGTVNDVCMAGGQPKYLSLSFIIEEGFLMEDFKTIVNSIATTAQLAGVQIVTGDTKVVERGKGDGIYINTSGVGPQRAAGLSRKAICPGDCLLYTSRSNISRIFSRNLQDSINRLSNPMASASNPNQRRWLCLSLIHISNRAKR